MLVSLFGEGGLQGTQVLDILTLAPQSSEAWRPHTFRLLASKKVVGKDIMTNIPQIQWSFDHRASTARADMGGRYGLSTLLLYSPNQGTTDPNTDTCTAHAAPQVRKLVPRNLPAGDRPRSLQRADS